MLLMFFIDLTTKYFVTSLKQSLTLYNIFEYTFKHSNKQLFMYLQESLQKGECYKI